MSIVAFLIQELAIDGEVIFVAFIIFTGKEYVLGCRFILFEPNSKLLFAIVLQANALIKMAKVNKKAVNLLYFIFVLSF